MRNSKQAGMEREGSVAQEMVESPYSHPVAVAKDELHHHCGFGAGEPGQNLGPLIPKIHACSTGPPLVPQMEELVFLLTIISTVVILSIAILLLEQ